MCDFAAAPFSLPYGNCCEIAESRFACLAAGCGREDPPPPVLFSEASPLFSPKDSFFFAHRGSLSSLNGNGFPFREDPPKRIEKCSQGGRRGQRFHAGDSERKRGSCFAFPGKKGGEASLPPLLRHGDVASHNGGLGVHPFPPSDGLRCSCCGKLFHRVCSSSILQEDPPPPFRNGESGLCFRLTASSSIEVQKKAFFSESV